MKRNRKHALLATALLAMILASCGAGATSSSQRTEDPVKTSSGTSSSSSAGQASSGTSSSSSADKTSPSTSSSSSSSSSSSDGSSSSSSSSSDPWHGTSSDHSHESSDHSDEFSSNDSHETSHVTPVPTSSEPSSSSVHEHEFGDWYDYNDEYHWHPATCGHSEAEVWEPHDMAETIVAPTYESGGYTHHACKVCDYAYDDDYTDPLEHRYADEYSYDEETHWLACLDEGYEDLKLDEGDHVYGDWVVDTEATEETEGTRHRECEVCGYVQDGVIEPLPHVHRVDNWIYSDILVPAGSSDSSSETVLTTARHGECSKCHEDVVEELNYKSGDGVIIDSATYLSSVDFSGASAYKYMLDIGSTQQIKTQGYPYYNNWAKAYTPDMTSANALEEERLSHRIDSNRISGLSGRSNFTIRAFTGPGETTYRYFLIGYAAMSSSSQESAVYAVNWLGTYTYYQYFKYTSTTQSMTVSMLYPLRTADEFNAMVESMSGGSGAPKLTYVGDLEYSSLWSYDEKKHWHSSYSSYGDFRSEEGEHQFADNVVEPTFETEGFTTHTCSVCGYSYADSYVDPLEHSYSSDWTYDDEQHWRVCVDEGYETEEIGRADHQYGDWIVDLEPVPDVEGAKHRFCEVCGYREDETIDALPHVHHYSDAWSADETHHWHAATCAHTEEKSDVAEHDYDAGVVTPATLKTEGYTTHTCQTCGYQYVSDEVPAFVDQDKGDFEFNFYSSNHVASVKKYNGSSSMVYIPETVEKDGETYNVTSVMGSAFATTGAANIETLYFPKTLSSVADYGFTGLKNLKNIIVDEGNTNFAFDGDFLTNAAKTTVHLIRPGLTGDLHFPDTVTMINNDHLPHNFDKVYISAKIDDNGFNGDALRMLSNCNAFVVDENNKNWKAYDGILYTFDLTGLYGLPHGIEDDPDFPSTLTGIMANVGFDACAKLTRVDLSGTALTWVPNYCFSGCTALTEVLLPDTVTEIGSRAFYECEGIGNLVIPDGVTKLGSEALRFMSNLKTLHLPTALGEKGIGWGTLSDLPSLEEIALSASCEAHSVVGGILYNKAETEIELIPGAIEHVVLPETITSITQYTLQQLANVKTIDLGDGVTAIPQQAFFNCVNLETVHIGKAVESIGDYITSDKCKKFRSFTVDAENPNFTAVEGALYNKDVTELVHVPMGYRGIFNIPDTVSSVAGTLNPFRYHDQICGIRIPASATWFKTGRSSSGWVYDMHGLHFIVSALDPETQFYPYLYKASIITDPALDEYNVDAEGFIYADTARTILAGYMGSETDLVLPSTIRTIGTYCFAYNDDITSVVLPEGLLTIEDQAFQGCDSLTELVLPTTLTTLSDSSIDGNKLDRVIFQSTLTSVGYHCLSGCYNVSEVRLPDITDEAFGAPKFGSFLWISADTKLTAFSFAGTKARWQELQARADFSEFIYGKAEGLAKITVIHCTDGDILNPFAA